MASAKAVETIHVSIQDLYNIVVDYEKYPEFIPEMTSAKIKKSQNGIKIVDFAINLIKPVRYTLKLKETNPPYEMEWQLIESDFFKKNDGGWKLEEIDKNDTQATYYIDCDFNIFVPSIIVNKIVSTQLPKMLNCFKKRAES